MRRPDLIAAGWHHSFPAYCAQCRAKGRDDQQWFDLDIRTEVRRCLTCHTLRAAGDDTPCDWMAVYIGHPGFLGALYVPVLEQRPI